MNNSTTLSRAAQSVQDALYEKGLALEVIELSASTRTANDAATTIGCDVAQIIKSLLFRTLADHRPILILASGINRVNEKMIEKLMGEKIIKADADFAREITGFAIGGIPPVGHQQKINHIFIDQDLLKFEMLWAAAGTPHAVFSLHSSDLETLTNGKVISIQ
jgi:prolyl-tRNA editing enzyme YbaK/EbsC (Cys-tRNA(Pro) deacylase)